MGRRSQKIGAVKGNGSTMGQEMHMVRKQAKEG